MVSKIVRGAPNESRPRQGRSRKQPNESQQAASGPKPQNATQPQKNIPAIEPSVKAPAVVCASPPSASVGDSPKILSNADGQETLRKEQSEEQNHLGRSSDDDASIDPSSATSSNQSTDHADTPTGGKDKCVMDRWWEVYSDANLAGMSSPEDIEAGSALWTTFDESMFSTMPWDCFQTAALAQPTQRTGTDGDGIANEVGKRARDGKIVDRDQRPVRSTSPPLAIFRSSRPSEVYLLQHCKMSFNRLLGYFFDSEVGADDLKVLDNLASRLLPVVEPYRNPYKTVYGALARGSRPLRNAILFASTLHLTKLGDLPHDTIKTYRADMRDSFREALQADEEIWSLGATVLLSIIFDVTGTGMDSWSSKLVGCRRLLEQGLSRSKGQVSSEMKCVQIQYNWMSTMGRTLLLGTQQLQMMDDLAPLEILPIQEPRFNTIPDLMVQQHHWWANMPDYIMHILLREVADLSIAVHNVKSQPDSTEQLLQMMPEVADVVRKIEGWQPGVASVTPGYMDDTQHFNSIWKQGMLCYVYHEIYGLSSSSSWIQACVEVSLVAFEKLSWLQACLWPAFMIAIHAQTETARSTCENAFKKMHSTLGFTAPLSIVLVLQSLWGTFDSDGSGTAKWRTVMENLGMELNILL
uniref:Uncharacterized protein n=1 Tax=Colletotrichum fructicola (strain Nara gc5) TaxID=1213859 RepID=L2FYG6_COLFN